MTTDKLLFRGEIGVFSHVVSFETDCQEAFEDFHNKRRFFNIWSYLFRPNTHSSSRVPQVIYYNRPIYDIRCHMEREVFEVTAPWSANPSGRNLLEAAVWMALEVVRQGRGEYILHGSAVVRDGKGIVLMGPSEAGKTTIALDLVHNHGFGFFGNDRLLVGERNGIPTLLGGDPIFKFRFGSLSKYSLTLCSKVFCGERGQYSWNDRKLVQPEELGFNRATTSTPIRLWTFIRLDDTMSRLSIATPNDWLEFFPLRTSLYRDLSETIRGTFSPLDSELNFISVYMPCMDRPAYLDRRVAFLTSVMRECQVQAVRGPLSLVVPHLLEEFA